MERYTDAFYSIWPLLVIPLVVSACIVGIWIVVVRALAGGLGGVVKSIPLTGIELAFGIPGSGKSFIFVIRCMEAMRDLRRPVYTNLPLKMRVFRWFLRRKGGDDLANLVQPLTRDGFVRFTDRFVLRQQFRDDLRAVKPGIKRKDLARRWIAAHGEDITRPGLACRLDRVNGKSVDAFNWIPSGAVVMLDEVHQWFPNKHGMSVAKDYVEPSSLAGYLTMHRHMQHWVWITTQSEMQCPPTIRRLASSIARVWQRQHDSIFDPKGPLRKVTWGRLGVRSLGYKFYTPEHWDKSPDEPYKEFSYYPRAPWNQIIFRLYESFQHAGSPSELRQGMRDARIDAGLDGDGFVVATGNDGGLVMPKLRLVTRGLGCAVKGFVFVGAMAAAAAVAVVVSKSMDGGGVEAVGGSVTAAGVASSQPAAVAAAAASQPVDPSAGGVVESVSPSGVMFKGGRTVSTGGRYGELELASFDVRSGVSVWNHLAAGDVWVWSIGETARRLGNFSEVSAKLTAAGKRRAYLKGGGDGPVRR